MSGAVLRVFAWLVPLIGSLPAQPPLQVPSIRTASQDIGPGVHGLLAAVQPQEGCTYSWSILGGTVDSGAGTNQISFRVGAGSSVTLQCTVASSLGASAVGSLTLAVPTGGLNPMPTTTVGGSVQGLTGGTLVLQNNQGNNLVVTSNGNFTFGVPVASGAPYSVTVIGQPAQQTCTVAKAAGIVGNSGVADVAVSCSPSVTYPIASPSVTLGGTVVDSLHAPLSQDLSGEGVVMLRNALVADLDGDGYPEIVLGLTSYPNQVSQPVVVVGAKAGLSLPADTMFVGGVPETQHPNQMFTVDLDGDGRQDLVVGNAGLDHAPWTGGPVAVALNLGGGRYRNVSGLLPTSMAATRSYAVAAGDLRHDGRNAIILPDGAAPGNGFLSESLRWNGSGFDEDPNWISKQIWAHPGGLSDASWLGVADLDGDGYQDVIVAGNATRPNLRVLYGSASGFPLSDLSELPDGTWGHTPYLLWNLAGNPSSQGGNLDRVVVADFNGDGRPDLFALAEEATTYQPGVFSDPANPGYEGLRQNGGTAYTQIGLQVLRNEGGRLFTDVSASSSYVQLGLRYYVAAWATDLNNDGALDVVGLYYTKPYGSQLYFTWGTTFFLNDGTGAFQVVDGASVLPELVSTGPTQLGMLFPTSVTRRGMEGVLIPDGAKNPSLEKTFAIEKIVTARPIGTGPGLADPGAFGAPGFNEYFYLHTHPDVSASVRDRTFASGLDHYLRVGRAAGYQAFAQHTIAWGGASAALVTLYGANAYHCGTGGDTVRVAGGDNVVYSGPGNDVVSGSGNGSDVVVYSGPRIRYQVSRHPDGSTTVADSLAGGDGTDTIIGPFTLRFTDDSPLVNEPARHAPVNAGAGGHPAVRRP